MYRRSQDRAITSRVQTKHYSLPSHTLGTFKSGTNVRRAATTQTQEEIVSGDMSSVCIIRLLWLHFSKCGEAIKRLWPWPGHLCAIREGGEKKVEEKKGDCDSQALY